ncbi:hypothetical protein HUJ05_007856 [Dendroctonus ponderosae]|nr:hypothetical protein HUJ05_007856 [Dendroctonus ponderosae]
MKHLLITGDPGPIIIKLFAIIAALLQENGILIIDEIGKMELFSKKFEQCVETAFKKKNIRILATVPVRGPPFVAALKRDNGCQLFTVTRENRDSLFFDHPTKAKKDYL